MVWFRSLFKAKLCIKHLVKVYAAISPYAVFPNKCKTNQTFF